MTTTPDTVSVAVDPDGAPALVPTAELPRRRVIPTPGTSTTRAGRSRGASYRLGNVIVTIVLTIGSIVMLAPLIWTFSTSLKTKEAVFFLPPQWIPDPVMWENYVRMWSAGPLLSGIQNSVIVAASVTIIGTVTSSLAAFAFAKLRLPFKNTLFLVMLAGDHDPVPDDHDPAVHDVRRCRTGWTPCGR